MEFKIEFYLHAILLTDNHKKLINNKNEDLLYKYVDVALKRHACKLLQIGGTENHVHLVFEMSPEISIDELLKKVKLGSQTELQHKGFRDFFWSDGYYAYTIGAEDIEKERFNIMQQHLFHRDVTLEMELTKLRHELNMEETDELSDINESRMN